jgi:hypothetical protein
VPQCQHPSINPNPGHPSNSNGSTAWLQTKVFFQALGRNFVDEFKEGGCANTFLNAFNEGGSSHSFKALNLSDPAPGLGPDDVLREGGKAAAGIYAMNRALFVPLRSSIYRGYLAASETAAAGLVAVDIFSKAVEGAVAERNAFKAGECR